MFYCTIFVLKLKGNIEHQTQVSFCVYSECVNETLTQTLFCQASEYVKNYPYPKYEAGGKKNIMIFVKRDHQNFRDHIPSKSYQVKSTGLLFYNLLFYKTFFFNMLNSLMKKISFLLFGMQYILCNVLILTLN